MTVPQKTQAAMITAVLPAHRDRAITAKEIFADLDPADQGRFGNVANVSKALNQMRQRDATVANGNSEIIGGKTYLTWYKRENAAHAEQTPNNLAPVSPMAEQEQADAVADGQAVEIQPGENTTDAAHEQLAATSSAILKENAVETLARDGYLILDPLRESEQFICQVVNRLKLADLPPPKPVQIERKDLKIKALSLIAESPLIHDEFAEILSQIASDIEKLAAA